MASGMVDRLQRAVTHWLTWEPAAQGMPLSNYDRLLTMIAPCDVLLVEGRSRVSEVIKMISQTPWSHAALVVGPLSRIPETEPRERILALYPHIDPEQHLVVEAVLGQGTIITPLSEYRGHHLRICRPTGIRPEDARQVVAFAIHQLGADYDVRQLFDLARFLFPYAILPRRWRSSLFTTRPGDNTRNVCSSMLAMGFMSVSYPILPVVQQEADGSLRYYKRNVRLFTPRDFDQSPYFEIIKYPLVAHEDVFNYRDLPWDTRGLFCNREGDCQDPEAPLPEGWITRGRAFLRRVARGLRLPRLPGLARRFFWNDDRDDPPPGVLVDEGGKP